jgi:hypothetical protein
MDEPLLTRVRCAEHVLFAIAKGRSDLLSPAIMDLLDMGTELVEESSTSWSFGGHPFFNSGIASTLGAAAVVTAPLEAPTLLLGSAAVAMTHTLSALRDAPGAVLRLNRANEFRRRFGFAREDLLWSLVPVATLYWYLESGDTVFTLAIKAKSGPLGLDEDPAAVGRMLRRLVALAPGDGHSKAVRIEAAIEKSARDMGLESNASCFASAWRVVTALRSGELCVGLREQAAAESGNAINQTAGGSGAGSVFSDGADEAPRPLTADESCTVCFAAKRTHALIPCGHRCLCARCVNLDSLGHSCPICRTYVSDALRVYDP